MAAPGELTFVAPRRAKPPRHLADLSPAGRRAAMVALGELFDGALVESVLMRYPDRTTMCVSSQDDQAWRGDLLGRLLRGHLVHVNLIPLNPTPGSMWTASRPEDEKEFVRRLEAHGVAATVRDTRGREIGGGCGQLAAHEEG